jgi:hypothetical protein
LPMVIAWELCLALLAALAAWILSDRLVDIIFLVF